MSGQSAQTEQQREPSIIALLTVLTLVFAFAFVGFEGALPGLKDGSYEAMTKPAWAMSAVFFGPAWLVVHGMAAWGTAELYRAQGNGRRRASLGIVGLSLVLSAGWPWLYFGKQMHVLSAVLAIGAGVAAGLAMLLGSGVKRFAWQFAPAFAWGCYFGAIAATSGR